MRSVTRLLAATGMILAAIATPVVLSTPAQAQRMGGFHVGGFHGGMGGFNGGGFHGGMGFHGGFHHGGFHHHGFYPGFGIGLGLSALYRGYGWPAYYYPPPPGLLLAGLLCAATGACSLCRASGLCAPSAPLSSGSASSDLPLRLIV